MQRYRIQLSGPVDETAFLAEWQYQNHEINRGPNVDFTLQGNAISARLHTTAGKEWKMNEFRTAVQLVISKTNSSCRIEAIDQE
jgi:uncharacterized protein YdgA (DUF945 family)